MSIQRYPYDKNNVKEINLPTSLWSHQCPICKLLKNSRKHSEGNNASMFNCQVTEFQQNSRRRRACVQMFSKQTISIFSHNIRCNTLWKTTLAAWKTIHALLCCCCCLPQSFRKSNGLVSKDLQKYHFCSSLLVAPVSRHQLVCKSS